VARVEGGQRFVALLEEVSEDACAPHLMCGFALQIGGRTA